MFLKQIFKYSNFQAVTISRCIPRQKYSIAFMVHLVFFCPKTFLSNLQCAKFEFVDEKLQKAERQKRKGIESSKTKNKGNMRNLTER